MHIYNSEENSTILEMHKRKANKSDFAIYAQSIGVEYNAIKQHLSHLLQICKTQTTSDVADSESESRALRTAMSMSDRLGFDAKDVAFKHYSQIRLAKAKSIEASNATKMLSCRVDRNTIVCSTSEDRLKMIINQLKKSIKT